MPREERLGSAQRLESGDRVSGLEKGLGAVAGKPGVRFEGARTIATDADHDARIVSAAPKEEGEHGRAAKAVAFHAARPAPPE